MSLLKKRDTFLLLIALCFAGKYLIIDSWKFHANDFAPIYVAAQSVADGKHISIYDHHPYLFNIVPPGEYKETAKKIGFKGILHPYLHLPLVSFLCRFLLFIPYRIIIKLLLLINFLTTLLSLHLILKLIGRGFDLRWLSITILAMAYFYPMRYSIRLGQTSPLVFLGIISIYYLAKIGHTKTSGFILGVIISLKITPIFFLCYFLIRKKWSLVISSVITLMVIGICSVSFLGWESNAIFFNNIIRLSGLSLASWNNQSLDGFLLRCVTGATHLYDWHLLELPFMLKVLKLTVLSYMFLLWLFIILQSTSIKEKNRDLLDFSLTLILLVVFSPISWSHYLLFLVLPYLVLLTTIIRNKTIPYRKLMIGGLLLSYTGVALPPSYFLLFLNFPLINKIPLPVLSSTGFLGGILLIVILSFIQLLSGKQSGRLKTPGEVIGLQHLTKKVLETFDRSILKNPGNKEI